MGPSLKKMGAAPCKFLGLMFISVSLLGLIFPVFPEGHDCTHDGECPVCIAFQDARQFPKPAGPGEMRAAAPNGARGLPGLYGSAGNSPLIRVSSVALKVRLNT